MSADHGTRTSGYLTHGSRPGGKRSAPVPRRWPAYVVAGPERHGVVRHALRTVEALHRIGVDVPLVRLDDAAHLRAWAAEGHGSGGPVHLDVTDALFAPTAAAAADLLLEHLPPRTTLTLHDVPQPAEGAGRYARRSAAYARLARFAAGTVVSSGHELALLQDLDPGGLEPAGPTAVVPLPVEDRRAGAALAAGAAPSGAGDGPAGGEAVEGLAEDVVLLGFLYPGKGHAEAIDALAWLRHRGVPAPDRVTALGAVAAGHEGLVTGLEDRAREAGLRFRVTGFVPDGELDPALLAAGVPLAAHHNVSASGSLAAWMSVGRRPVVPAGRYTREMERLRPGTLHLVDPGADRQALVAALTAGIARAAADPRATRLDPDVTLAPGPEDCARALAAFWEQVHA